MEIHKSQNEYASNIILSGDCCWNTIPLFPLCTAFSGYFYSWSYSKFQNDKCASHDYLLNNDVEILRISWCLSETGERCIHATYPVFFWSAPGRERKKSFLKFLKLGKLCLYAQTQTGYFKNPIIIGIPWSMESCMFGCVIHSVICIIVVVWEPQGNFYQMVLNTRDSHV